MEVARTLGAPFRSEPVLRFLEYGGQVAEDSLHGCRQIARDYGEDGEGPMLKESVYLKPSSGSTSSGMRTRPVQASVAGLGPRLRRPHIFSNRGGLVF